MAYEGTISKMADARAAMDGMDKATSAPEFRYHFHAFTAAVRAVLDTVEREGKQAMRAEPGRPRLAAFEEWVARNDYRRGDHRRPGEVIDYICTQADANLHEGQSGVDTSGFHIQHLSVGGVDDAPPPDGATAFVVGRDGPGWIVDEGLSTERFVAKHDWDGVLLLSLNDAPTSSEGTELGATSPAAVCGAALRYIERVAHEARTQFTP